MFHCSSMRESAPGLGRVEAAVADGQRQDERAGQRRQFAQRRQLPGVERLDLGAEPCDRLGRLGDMHDALGRRRSRAPRASSAQSSSGSQPRAWRAASSAARARGSRRGPCRHSRRRCAARPRSPASRGRGRCWRPASAASKAGRSGRPARSTPRRCRRPSPQAARRRAAAPACAPAGRRAGSASRLRPARTALPSRSASCRGPERLEHRLQFLEALGDPLGPAREDAAARVIAPGDAERPAARRARHLHVERRCRRP